MINLVSRWILIGFGLTLGALLAYILVWAVLGLGIGLSTDSKCIQYIEENGVTVEKPCDTPGPDN